MEFTKQDRLEMGHMKFAQGEGASLRYANELRSYQQIGRLAPLQSSNLHMDVIRGNLGPTGLGINPIFNGKQEDDIGGITRVGK